MPNGLALAINILIVLFLLSYVISMVLNLFSPYYATPKKLVKEIVKKFGLKSDEKFADLGCGDGRVVWATYKIFQCESKGYEISPVLLLIIKLSKAIFAPFNKKIQFIEEDFFKVDLKEFNVIYCCLPDDVLEILSKKFRKELKKGSRVYTYKRELPNLKGKIILVGSESIFEYIF